MEKRGKQPELVPKTFSICIDYFCVYWPSRNHVLHFAWYVTAWHARITSHRATCALGSLYSANHPISFAESSRIWFPKLACRRLLSSYLRVFIRGAAFCLLHENEFSRIGNLNTERWTYHSVAMPGTNRAFIDHCPSTIFVPPPDKFKTQFEKFDQDKQPCFSEKRSQSESLQETSCK